MQLIKVYSKSQPQYFVIITHDDVSDAVHTVGGEYETMPADLEGEFIGCAGAGYDHYYAISAESVPEEATEGIEPQLDEFDIEIIKHTLMRADIALGRHTPDEDEDEDEETKQAFKTTHDQIEKTLSKIKIISNEMVRS